MAEGTRGEELASNLRRVQEQIADVAVEAGRRPADVTLVVVTKTFPASDIRLLHGLGVRDIGENRHPEAAEKAADLVGLGLVWHFIGQVQSNKAARIASYADVVHSVDSVRVVTRLATGALDREREVACLVQVSLDPPGGSVGRGGVTGSAVEDIADAVDAAEGLRLGGVMGVAPPGGTGRGRLPPARRHRPPGSGSHTPRPPWSQRA